MTEGHWSMAVCPHDTADHPEVWFFFTQELSKRLGRSVRLELILDFSEFQQSFPRMDLVYANPPHSLVLTREMGFLPVARFAKWFDEAVLVCRKNDAFALPDVAGRTVATANIPLVTRLITDVLHRHGVEAQAILERNSWGEALTGLLKGETDFAILYRDFYHGLQQTTKDELLVLWETDEQRLFHSFLLAPGHADQLAALQDVLVNFHHTPSGMQALQELKKEGLVAVSLQDLEAFDASDTNGT